MEYLTVVCFILLMDMGALMLNKCEMNKILINESFLYWLSHFVWGTGPN